MGASGGYITAGSFVQFAYAVEVLSESGERVPPGWVQDNGGDGGHAGREILVEGSRGDEMGSRVDTRDGGEGAHVGA